MRPRPLALAAIVIVLALVAAPLALAYYARDEPPAPHVTVAPGADTFTVISAGDGARATHVVLQGAFPFLELEVVHKRVVAGQPGESIPIGNGATLRVPAADKLRVAFVGDSGSGPEAARVLDEVAKAAPDLVVHVGDIAYSDGDERAWDAWISLVTTKLPGVPVAYATGNHDVESSVDAREIAILRGGASYYSFDVGPVHFVVLDSNAVGDAQKAWLADDLAAAKRAGASWIVPVEHHPWYSTGRTHGGLASARDAFEPLFAQYGVKLAVAGHEHEYERSKPINGTTFVVTGGGGAPLYDDFGPAASWDAARGSHHEFLLVDFTRTDARAEARLADGGTLDSFTLTP